MILCSQGTGPPGCRVHIILSHYLTSEILRRHRRHHVTKAIPSLSAIAAIVLSFFPVKEMNE